MDTTDSKAICARLAAERKHGFKKKKQVIKWVQWMKNKSDYLPNLASNLMIYGIFFSFAVLVK